MPRVSSDSNAQGESLENQVTHYTNLITANPEYEYVGVFADQGITGTKDKRPEFQRMLEQARQGNIDLILTKSISRFARNTTIVLEVVREMKELNVEVFFEKEQISSCSGDGELMLTVLSAFAQEESKSVSENIKWRYRRKFEGETLLTILSSLAQDESRAISENFTWGIRRRFEQGQVRINYTKFLGYGKDKNGELIINKKQANIVRRIYADFLDGKGANMIARELERDGVPNWNGKVKWYDSSIRKMWRMKNSFECDEINLWCEEKGPIVRKIFIKNMFDD
jgi:DNA invertase Pin-like site-specific DNA recombinase